MGRNKNIISRKKLMTALEQVNSPFSSRDLSDITGLTPGCVAALLKDVEGLDRIPVSRSTGARVNYRFSSGDSV